MTTPSQRTKTPLERLREVSAAEASRREAARESNRKRDPQFAGLVDMARALGADVQIEHWKSHDGTIEVGKVRPLPAGSYEIGAAAFAEMQRALKVRRK